MATDSIITRRVHSRARPRLLRELARDYQLHLIIALPVIWFIIFRYLPMYGVWRDNQDENRATIRMRIDVAARPRVA